MTPVYILLFFQKKRVSLCCGHVLANATWWTADQAVGRSAFQLTHFVDPMHPVHPRLPQRNIAKQNGPVANWELWWNSGNLLGVGNCLGFFSVWGKNPWKNGPPIARGWSCLRTTVDILHLDPPLLRIFSAFATMTRFTAVIIDVWHCLINVFLYQTSINSLMVFRLINVLFH